MCPEWEWSALATTPCSMQTALHEHTKQVKSGQTQVPDHTPHVPSVPQTCPLLWALRGAGKRFRNVVKSEIHRMILFKCKKSPS